MLETVTIFGKNVLIEPLQEETEKKVGFIIVPTAGNSSTKFGVIVAAGLDTVPEIHCDDKVCYNSYTATELTIDGKLYHLIDKENIYYKY